MAMKKPAREPRVKVDRVGAKLQQLEAEAAELMAEIDELEPGMEHAYLVEATGNPVGDAKARVRALRQRRDELVAAAAEATGQPDEAADS